MSISSILYVIYKKKWIKYIHIFLDVRTREFRGGLPMLLNAFFLANISYGMCNCFSSPANLAVLYNEYINYLLSRFLTRIYADAVGRLYFPFLIQSMTYGNM